MALLPVLITIIGLLSLLLPATPTDLVKAKRARWVSVLGIAVLLIGIILLGVLGR